MMEDMIGTGRLATAALLLTASFLFVKDKLSGESLEEHQQQAKSHAFASGLIMSFVATLGNTAAAMLRKQLSSLGVSSAEQVGLATMIQGCGAFLYCHWSSQEGVVFGHVVKTLPFAIPAIGSSVLNAVTKTLETRAYATTDVSLCAPFLAFDPVMQFLLPVLFAPALCSVLNVLCDEAHLTFPSYHPLAVMCVAAGAFLLKSEASSTEETKKKKKDDDETGKLSRVGNHPRRKKQTLLLGLPVGSWFILANCCVYAVTSRLDKAAVNVAGKTTYYTYSRLVMGATSFAGARPSRRSLAKFANPHAVVLLLAVCAAEALYLLALYQAFAKISPVYVTSVKRGGGLLFSALASALFFDDPIRDRLFPIVAIVAGVVLLCL